MFGTNINFRLYTVKIRDSVSKAWQKWLQEERGDIVGALGWMAITAVMLVAISAVLNGKMTNLVNSVFSKLEGLLI